MIEKSEGLQKAKKHSFLNNTKKVFVLKHSKLKGDTIKKSDLVLSEKKKVMSNGAINDLKSVLGKRLKKKLKGRGYFKS